MALLPPLINLIQNALNDSKDTQGDYQAFLERLTKGTSAVGTHTERGVIEDMQGKYFDQLLAYRALQEQREFDKPEAQLQRLMQTGMSRDAALALIGSGGSGSSGGSPLIGASAPLVPSESELRQAQKDEAYSNIAFNGLNTLANLASIGAQIPIYMQSAQNLEYQNQIQGMILEAQNVVNGAHDVIKQAIDADVISGSVSEFTGSKDNLQKALDGLAKKGFKPAIDFVSGDNMKLLKDSPYANQIASQEKINMLQSDQYMRDCFNQNRAADTYDRLQRVNVDLVASMIEYYSAQVGNIHYDNLLKISEAALNEFNAYRGSELLSLEKKQIRSNIRLSESQRRVNLKNLMVLGAVANLNNQQARSIRMQNDVLSGVLYTPQLMPDGKTTTGFNQITRSQVWEFYEHTKELSACMGNKKWFDDRLQTIFHNQSALSSYAFMNDIYAGQLSNRYRSITENDIFNFSGSHGEFSLGLHLVNWFYGQTIYPMSGVEYLAPFQGEQNSFNFKNIPLMLKAVEKLVR